MSDHAVPAAVHQLHPPDHPDTPHAPQHAWRHALRLAAASERMIAQMRATLGLSSNEMNALLLLHDGGPTTMTRLARRIRLSRAALSVLVDRLEADDWLARERDPNDRRSVRVAVTDRFEREFYDASRRWRQRLHNLASEHGDDWPVLVDHLAAICDVCDRSAGELADEPPITRPAR